MAAIKVRWGKWPLKMRWGERPLKVVRGKWPLKVMRGRMRQDGAFEMMRFMMMVRIEWRRWIAM